MHNSHSKRTVFTRLNSTFWTCSNTHNHWDKLFFGTVRCAFLRCVPCDAHLLYTAQWTFKLRPTHTQPGLLIAYYGSTMSQSFQVKQSGTLVYIIKVTSTRFSKYWLTLTGRADTELSKPTQADAQHPYPHSWGAKRTCWHIRAQKQSHVTTSVLTEKVWWTEGARCGHQMTRQLLDLKQPDGVIARWFLEEQRWWQWWWHQDDEDVEEEDRTGEMVKSGDESIFKSMVSVAVMFQWMIKRNVFISLSSPCLSVSLSPTLKRGLIIRLNCWIKTSFNSTAVNTKSSEERRMKVCGRKDWEHKRARARETERHYGR